MNTECKVTKVSRKFYSTVMGPTSAIFPVLCADCIEEKTEVGIEEVKELAESTERCTVCGQESTTETEGHSEHLVAYINKPVSKESFAAAADWGWTR